jgi:O-antigen/teichoic acid export membrane protein
LRDALRDPPMLQTKPGLAPMLRFGLKGMIGSLYPVESFRIDQIFVGLFLSPLALGYYVVAVAFTNLPRFIAQSVGLVAYPQIASQRDHATRRRWLWIFAASTGVLLVLCVGLLEIALTPFVRIFFGPSFLPSVPIAQVLLAAGLFLGGRRILAEGLKGAGYPFAGTASELASWVALAPCLAIVAAFRFGPVAVALSVLVSAVVSVATILLVDYAHSTTAATSDSKRDDSIPAHEGPEDSEPMYPN